MSFLCDSIRIFYCFCSVLSIPLLVVIFFWRANQMGTFSEKKLAEKKPPMLTSINRSKLKALLGSGLMFYNLHQPVNESHKVNCVLVNRTEAASVFYICVHENAVDKFVSKSISAKPREGWERGTGIKIEKIIKMHPDAVFLDIGAHIGCHALYAAALGTRVVAVEPNYQNHPHLHKAVQMSKFQQRFILVTNGISNNTGFAVMNTAPSNMGHTFVIDGRENATNGSSFIISMSTLDDLVPVVLLWSNRSIIKIDVEGHECMVFGKHSWHFLKTIDVPYILMEWTFSKAEKTCTETMLNTLDHYGYELEDMNGKKMQPVSLKNTSNRRGLMDMVWKKKLQKLPNLNFL